MVCKIFIHSIKIYCNSELFTNSFKDKWFQNQITSIHSNRIEPKICFSPVHFQLRLDFDMFVISGPSTLSDSVGVTLNGAPVTDITKGVAVATASQCLTDTFSISNPGGQNPPVICGSNNGEHGKITKQIYRSFELSWILNIVFDSLCWCCRGLQHYELSIGNCWRWNTFGQSTVVH